METHPSESLEKHRLIDVARMMEETRSEDEMRECVNNFLDFFPEVFHTTFSSDITRYYRAMEREGFLVRLERLSAVMEDLLEHKPIQLGEAGEDHYANAVLPHQEGIKIAFSEGMAPGPIRLLMGFDVRSAIGFDPKSLEVSDITTHEFDLRDTSLRARVCRHVKGKLLPEQIKYLILRLSRRLVHDRHLTDFELENEAPFVFRGVQF